MNKLEFKRKIIKEGLTERKGIQRVCGGKAEYYNRANTLYYLEGEVGGEGV